MTWIDVAMLITLWVLFFLLYRSTKRQEEIEEELTRHVAEYFKHNPGKPRRDNKGRFINQEE